MACSIFIANFEARDLFEYSSAKHGFQDVDAESIQNSTRKVASNDSDDPRTFKSKTMQWRLNITQFPTVILFFCLNVRVLRIAERHRRSCMRTPYTQILAQITTSSLMRELQHLHATPSANPGPGKSSFATPIAPPSDKQPLAPADVARFQWLR